MPVAQRVFARFGLQMHIGERIDETTLSYERSKTECMFVPRRGFFTQHAIECNIPAFERILDIDDEACDDQARESRDNLLRRLYQEAPETAEIPMDGGRITFSLSFKYLGTIIDAFLRDDREIEKRIMSVECSFGAMKEFYARPEVSVITKYRIFMAIQINLLLWGCEGWALRKDLLLKLQRCVNRKVRSILNISMTDVKDNRITLDNLRAMFNDIPRVESLVDARMMKFLGTILRSNVSHPPRQILISFIPKTRPVGRPLKSNKEYLWQALCRMMKNTYVSIDHKGSLRDFYLLALDDSWWNKMVARILDPSIPLPERPNDDFDYLPRRSRRHASSNGASSASSSEESQNDSSRTNVSPPRYQYPRQNRNGARSSREESDDQSSSRPDSDRTYDEANVGKVMRDSLIILGLDFSSSCNDAKAQYRLLASKYHPDKHSLFGAETGMTIPETTHFFQLINSAYTYLCTKL